MQKKLELSIGLFFLSLLIFLCFNLNSKNTFSDYKAQTNYKNPIWADAAGYYVYLPSTFIYGWEANALPRDWPDQLGNGFKYDEAGKLQTKYPVGVALLESPFFLLAHSWAWINGNADGYSYEYHIGVWVAGFFYLILGLFFLKEYLAKRYDMKSVLLTLFFILTGTNLYYYGLNSSGMSHVYSFFLFAVVLWLSDKIIEKKLPKHFILFSFLAGLVLMVRPTGILYLVFLMFLVPNLVKNLLFKPFQRPLVTLLMLIAFALPIMPQLIYWKYLTGHFLHYSYGGEVFNLLSPEIAKFWFSTNNGLFIYAPILIFSLLGMVFMLRKNRTQGLKFILFFVVVSYIFSAWWCWWYGCSYGSRNFVEYLVPLSIPFCLFVQRTFTTRFTSMKYFLISLGAFFVFINLKIIYKYDDCFYRSNSELWDWNTYYKLIF